jgi:AI-2 transport protein TqsA
MVNLAKQVFSDIREWGIELDQAKIIETLQNRIPKLVGDTFGAIMGFSSALLFVVIFLMFLLIGRRPRVVSSGIYKDVDEQIRKYIGTKAVISMATGLLVWVTLSLFGLELAGVFGIFAFMLNFIPSIGSIIATLLPIPIAVAQFENRWIITAVVLVPGAIQMSIGNVIEPKLMGEGLQLHPVVILLALSFWGLLWGVVGMFLAVPMTAIIRIVLMQFETLRPVGRFLAGELPGMKQ